MTLMMDSHVAIILQLLGSVTSHMFPWVLHIQIYHLSDTAVHFTEEPYSPPLVQMGTVMASVLMWAKWTGGSGNYRWLVAGGWWLVGCGLFQYSNCIL